MSTKEKDESSDIYILDTSKDVSFAEIRTRNGKRREGKVRLLLGDLAFWY